MEGSFAAGLHRPLHAFSSSVNILSRVCQALLDFAVQHAQKSQRDVERIMKALIITRSPSVICPAATALMARHSASHQRRGDDVELLCPALSRLSVVYSS